MDKNLQGPIKIQSESLWSDLNQCENIERRKREPLSNSQRFFLQNMEIHRKEHRNSLSPGLRVDPNQNSFKADRLYDHVRDRVFERVRILERDHYRVYKHDRVC